jgi:hypothetical protein
MSNFETLIGKLEHSNEWGFGDAFGLIVDYTKHLGQAHSSDKAKWDKVYKPVSDVWTSLTDGMRNGKVRIKGGKIHDIHNGPLLAENPNTVVIDKISFLVWYRANKEKIIQYLSCGGLKINEEGFLDRLASAKQPSKGGRPPFPYKEQVKQAVEKLLKRRPDIQQGKIPYMPEVVNVFAPSKGAEADSDMSAKEYKNHFGWAVSTIENIIAEVYKTRL